MRKITIIFVLAVVTHITFSQSLFEAIESKNNQKLEQLLKEGSSTEQYNDKGLTPLWIAVWRNNSEAVEILLKYKS